MSWFRPEPRPTVKLDTARAYVQSLRAIDVAEALFRYERLSKHALLTDLSVPDQQKYHRIAEWAIRLLDTPEAQ